MSWSFLNLHEYSWVSEYKTEHLGQTLDLTRCTRMQLRKRIWMEIPSFFASDWAIWSSATQFFGIQHLRTMFWIFWMVFVLGSSCSFFSFLLMELWRQSQVHGCRHVCYHMLSYVYLILHSCFLIYQILQVCHCESRGNILTAYADLATRAVCHAGEPTIFLARETNAISGSQ